MALAVTKGQTPSADHRSSRLQEMSWNEIQRPGCYLILGSGDLVRVPQDALAPGHSPLITITSSGETRVAKPLAGAGRRARPFCAPVHGCRTLRIHVRFPI